MSYMTRDWAIRQCLAHFDLMNEHVAFIEGPLGCQRLLQFWQEHPGAYYEHPLPLLRQEWYHAANAGYAHGGFWAALPPGALVLDYGCGTAEVARVPWIARGGAIVLVEASVACLDYLHAKYRDYTGVQMRSGVGAWETLGPFDGLICTDVLEHVPHPLAVQQKLWSLLKPGGHALLKFESVFPHPGHLQESIAELPAWWQWVKETTQVVEVDRFVWCCKTKRKPL